MEEKKSVRAYVFDPDLMKKFILVKTLSLSIYDILELWSKNFC
jgi:hypothetical protein